MLNNVFLEGSRSFPFSLSHVIPIGTVLKQISSIQDSFGYQLIKMCKTYKKIYLTYYSSIVLEETFLKSPPLIFWEEDNKLNKNNFIGY